MNYVPGSPEWRVEGRQCPRFDTRLASQPGHMFFRFPPASRTIIYAWLNDENTMRNAGSHTDPYAVFHGMLERGAPPRDWDALVRAYDAVQGGPDSVSG